MNLVTTAARSRAARISALAAASPLLLAACGPDLDSLRSGPIPEKAPEVDTSALPPEPGDDAPYIEKVEWNLLESTSVFARTTDPDAVAECPDFSVREDSEIVCTVTFHGVEAEWDVSVNGGSFFVNSKMAPRGRHVVRDVAEEMLRFEADTETVRCDMKKVQVVPLDSGKKEPVTCEWGRAEESWKMEGTEGVMRIRASGMAAAMGQNGAFQFSSMEK